MELSRRMHQGSRGGGAGFTVPDVSTVIVKRSPRRPAPEIPSGELVVQAPPEIPPVPPSRWQQMVQVVPMLTGTLATALLFAGRDGGTYSYVIGAVFGFSTLG